MEQAPHSGGNAPLPEGSDSPATGSSPEVKIRAATHCRAQMSLESLCRQQEAHEQARQLGAVCWMSLPAAFWGTAGLPPLPALLLGHIAANRLESH